MNQGIFLHSGMGDAGHAAKGSVWKPLLFALLVIAAIAGGVVVFLSVRHHRETGEWKLPTANSFVRIANGKKLEKEPSRLIYLHRGGVELKAGVDNAAENTSSIVANGARERVVTSAFGGSNRQWNSIVQCTQKLFAPYDVEVTDTLPLSDNYILVAVGGTVDSLHQTKHAHASGLAPFIPNTVIPGAVVFAFSATLKNQTQPICDTIGMEVGHAYGLDHGYDCKDVMTYLKRCGRRSFTDKDIPCGEGKARACAGGNAKQNSHRYLLELLGPGKS